MIPTDGGQEADERFLIVNADDFGQTEGVNVGVLRAHDEGIVTSASLMVRWPGAKTAAIRAAARPTMSVGLHLDFGEWDYDGTRWRARYHVSDFDNEAAVRTEATRQLERFRDLVGRDPTHIDSHQHVHMRAPFGKPIRRFAEELGLPLRRKSGPVAYTGAFYGQSGRGERFPDGIMVDALLLILRQLPQGLTELGCHPAAYVDMEGMYTIERTAELAALCDRRVRDALGALRITLRSFNDAPVSIPSPSPM